MPAIVSDSGSETYATISVKAFAVKMCSPAIGVVIHLDLKTGFSRHSLSGQSQYPVCVEPGSPASRKYASVLTCKHVQLFLRLFTIQ